jgi:ribonuclease HI
MGWQIVFDDDVSIEDSRFIEANHTSMEAEYYALLEGIRYARRHGDEVEVFCDCKPLVEKMRVPDSNEDWYERRRGCHRLLQKFERWELEWTPRSANTKADRLAYEALERGRQS